MKARPYVLLAVLFAFSGEGMAKPDTATGSCEQITVPLCMNVHYNHTLMPNSLGHTTQESAALEVHQFYPLVKVQCSAALKPLVCSVYVPECKSGRVHAPCKSTCVAAKQGCQPLMNKFGFKWPTVFDCDLFSEESCDKSAWTTFHPDIKITDLPYLVQRKDIADHDKVLSPTTWRILFLYTDRDGSGVLNGEEYEALKTHLSVLRQRFTERWQPGPHDHQSFRSIIELFGVNLSQKTTEALWNINSIGKDAYDEFVAILTKLATLKGRFDTKVLSLPCDCKIAGFTFDELIVNAVL